MSEKFNVCGGSNRSVGLESLRNDENDTNWGEELARIKWGFAVSETVSKFERLSEVGRPEPDSHFLAGQGKNARWSSASQIEQT